MLLGDALYARELEQRTSINLDLSGAGDDTGEHSQARREGDGQRAAHPRTSLRRRLRQHIVRRPG